MYEKFYGFTEPPFNLTPDPSFLFLNKRTKDALDLILYGIERREGFAVIFGDVGTGKTTMCWALLERLAGRSIRTALIQNPMLSETDILRSILQDLGVRPSETADSDPTAVSGLFDADWMLVLNKKQLLDRLNAFLAERAREDVFTVLIVDEAQNMPISLLEQLRLISNLETAKKKLLQIIFVGQLQLDRKLKMASMQQLNQRISVRFETKPLSADDTERYIRQRLAVAGASPKLRFLKDACREIWRQSRGYPRLINLLCDRALMTGCSENSLVITKGIVRRGSRRLRGEDLEGPRLRTPSFRRLIPYMIASVILLALVGMAVYHGL